MTEHQDSKDLGSARFITLWTVLIMLGLVLEFFGRLFGYADNPWHFSTAAIPALTGIIAAIIILFGYLTLTGKRAKQQTMTRRTGVLLIALGASMLVGFFLFKQMIPQIFG
jgi:hypothetical protein